MWRKAGAAKAGVAKIGFRKWNEEYERRRWFELMSSIKWSTPSDEECGEKAISHKFKTSKISHEKCLLK